MIFDYFFNSGTKLENSVALIQPVILIIVAMQVWLSSEKSEIGANSGKSKAPPMQQAKAALLL